jgi:predicted phage baseplate assembly protein
VEGARTPTGVQNVTAVYRSGIGSPGNVDAGQITMLQTRPLGVKSVNNPLAASGGANREDITNARQNAPYAVMSLDRLVSTEDYGNFSRTFAGVGKAISTRLSDGHRELVEVTIAGVDDAAIDVNSDLYQNLLLALQLYGDPAMPVQLDVRELILLVASIKIKLLPGYLWDPVALAVRAAVLDAFSFDKRSFGQPALKCELIAAVQNVQGVDWMDVDAFGGIPEKAADENGNRVLLTFTQIANLVAFITGASMKDANNPYAETGPPENVIAGVAAFQGNTIRPAQLAIFNGDVQDSLVLHQIL